MPFINTPIPGLVVFEPSVFKDDRGYFFESYSEKLFGQNGIKTDFVQDNESKSSYGVLRGLHYQVNPTAQAKMVRVAMGEVFDVAVDIRKGSPTYGKWYGEILSSENKKQMFIPRGFAHGFSVLSETAVFVYKCDNYYSREDEGGIVFNDKALNIDWKLPADKIIVSTKDIQLPTLENCLNNFVYGEKF